MQTQKKTAIVLGATGLTGSFLLEKLLQDETYGKVKVFTRKPVGRKHPRLQEFLIDLFALEEFEEEFFGDEVFVCIGTTKKKTPDEETYRKIDFGIPVTAAKLAARNKVEKFLVISALGVSSDSKIFYNRTKGEMEEAVLAEGIKRTYLFRPSLITGDRRENRMMEAVGQGVMSVLNPLFIGSWRKYRSIPAETIAEAMLLVARDGYPKKRIPSDEIVEIVNRSRR